MVEEKDPLDEYIERIGSISLDAMHVTSEVRVVLYRVRTRLRSLEQRALDAAPAEAKRLSALEDAVTGLDGWRTTERNDSGMMQMTIHDGPPHLRGANNDHSNIDNEPGSGQSREGDDSGHEKDDGPQGNRRQRNAETGGDSGLLDSPIARPVSGGDESDRGRLTAVQPIDAAPAPAEWAPRDWYPADAKRTWAAMSLEERRRVIGNAAPAPAAAPSSPPTIALCEACGAAVLPHLRKVEPVNVELLAAVKEFHDFAVNGRRMMSAGDWMLLGERLTATISAAEAAPTTQAPPVFDARTLLLIRMGRACVDWVTDDPEGSCHLCERDERGEHDEECLFAAYLRTPAEAAEAPPKSERGALERLRVVVSRALRDLRFDQSQYMKGQRDGLTIALTAIEAEPSALDAAPAPAAVATTRADRSAADDAYCASGDCKHCEAHRAAAKAPPAAPSPAATNDRHLCKDGRWHATSCGLFGSKPCDCEPWTDPLHPTGCCTCCGEGTCDFCKTICKRCGGDGTEPSNPAPSPVNARLLDAARDVVRGRDLGGMALVLALDRFPHAISAAEAAPASRSPAEERGALERLRDLAAGLVPGFDVEGDYAEAARSVAMQLGVAIDVELAKLGADERPIDWEARAKKAEAFVASICDAADGPRPNEEQVRIAREASAPPGRVQENPGLLDAALAAFDKEIAFVGDDPGDSAESASYADGVRWAKARLLVLAKEQPPVPVVETAKLARAFADGVASVDVKAAMVAAVKRCCFLIFNASGEEDVETKLVADINAGAWYPQLQADIEAGRDPLISSEKEAVAQVERERSLMIAAVDEVLARARKDVFYRGADDVTLQDVVAHLSVDIDSGAFVPDLPEPAAVAPPIPEVELTDECEAEMVANAAVVTTMSKSMSKRLAVQRGEPTPTFDDRSVPLGDGGTPVSPPEREDGRERSLHRPSGMGGPEHRRQSAGPCDREGLIDRRTNAAAEPAPSPAEMVANAEVVTSMRWRAAADDVLAAEQLAYDGDLTPERFVRLMRSPKVGLDADVADLLEQAANHLETALSLIDDLDEDDRAGEERLVAKLRAAIGRVGKPAPPCPECAGSGVGVHGCDCPCGAVSGRTWRLTVHDGPGGRFAHAFAAFGTPIIRLGGTCLDGLTEVEVTMRGVAGGEKAGGT